VTCRYLATYRFTPGLGMVI